MMPVVELCDRTKFYAYCARLECIRNAALCHGTWLHYAPPTPSDEFDTVAQTVRQVTKRPSQIPIVRVTTWNWWEGEGACVSMQILSCYSNELFTDVRPDVARR